MRVPYRRADNSRIRTESRTSTLPALLVPRLVASAAGCDPGRRSAGSRSDVSAGRHLVGSTRQGFGLGGVISTFGLVGDVFGFVLFLVFVLASSIVMLRRGEPVALRG
jgi:hypothetical protein